MIRIIRPPLSVELDVRTKQLNGEIGAAADRVRHARSLWRRAQPRQSLRDLLIDPTVDDPSDHLALALSVGEYRPRTDKGQHTIVVLRLNRAVLVDGRQQARRVIELALPGWHDAMRLGDRRRMNECLLTIRMQPFAEVITAMLLAAVQPGAEVVFRHDRRLHRILLEPRLRASLLN
ncbi:hypothetical protein QEZ54_02700 [Catellatospora sp. KI3]|uniref:hypothetical protein n=1 Tax=Catellatospora sp. KI3 TaxID=3041620 RepID=UPI002482A34E|nr:hypothetical protein [Catellatospora sp. KI3]MDI1459867.1 hypothetical protein [Catellatospora sp. KI3]